jgi:hypothetical protein
MPRKKLLVCVALIASLVGVGTAAAYITPPPPGTWNTLTVCYNPARTIGSGDAPSNPVIHAGNSVTLRIGWGANTEAQSLNFLDAQNGIPGIQVHQGSATGTVVATATWPAGDTSGWTAPVQITNPAANGGKPFWQTFTYRTMGPFAAGTYYIDADLKVTKTVFDGSDVYKAGSSWISITGCPMVVSA